jgi:hypothetical protein
MVLLTYQLPDAIREIAMQGEFNEFDLNLKLGAQKPPMPFSDTRLLGVLSHSFWFLPSVAACHANAQPAGEETEPLLPRLQSPSRQGAPPESARRALPPGTGDDGILPFRNPKLGRAFDVAEDEHASWSVHLSHRGQMQYWIRHLGISCKQYRAEESPRCG